MQPWKFIIRSAPSTGPRRQTALGNFAFPNVPFNPYHLSVSAAGFAAYSQDVEIRSAVPLVVKITLPIAASSDVVTVESGGDLVENDPTGHTDIDQGTIQ